MARKGQFKKGGGRHGGGSSKSKAIVRYRTKAVTKWRTRAVARRGRGRRRRSGDGITLSKLLPIAGAALALGYVSGEGNMPEVTDVIKKIPGAKTVGVPMAVGALALGVNKFVFRNKWLRLAGVVGVAVGAYQLGVKKLDVTWMGDPDDGGPIDD